MSCSYAEGLSPYEDKGILGLKEIFDTPETVNEKVRQLVQWMKEAKHVVVHTGAGISTTAGIPDFRGPNGVWTLEERGEKPSINIQFDDAVPTVTHMALLELVRTNKVHYVVSQNIDGLHLKSGIPREKFAELHGNMFIEQCNKCKRQFVMNTSTSSVGQKPLNRLCPFKTASRRCRGKTNDTILDWAHELPDKDLKMADYHSSVADLSICLGTTLQIVPSGNLPLMAKKQANGKVVICNLQPTKHDKKSALVIHSYVDDIMKMLMNHFNLEIPQYDPTQDPTKQKLSTIEWTIQERWVTSIREIYYDLLREKKKNKLTCDTVKKMPSKKLKRCESIDESMSDCTVDSGICCKSPPSSSPGVCS